MFRRFLVLQWKTAIRAPMWQKNLILNLIIGFFLLLTFAYLLMIGIFLDEIFEDFFPEYNPFELFNSILLYYFLIDLLFRFLFQSLPRLNIESYLHLPLAKSRIIHYMEGRSIFDVFNFMPLTVIIPVTFTIVKPEMGSWSALIWILTMLMSILANNFFATWMKRLLGAKPLMTGGIALLIIVLFGLDKLNVISLSVFSSKVFGYIVLHKWLLILPLAWLVFTYTLHYRFLLSHLFPDEIQKKKIVEYEPGTTGKYLRSLGLLGSIISLELKLYWRNKRTRTIIYMLPIFLLYGLMFYPQPEYEKQYGFLMFVGVFMTGGMMLNYCNYAFGYESGYFDTLLTKSIDFSQYIRVKYLFAVIIATSCYILTIPYVYFGYKILLVNTAMYLYNIGILSFVLLYFATYNKKRMDLSRGGSFNYQGVGASNWLAILPAFLLPILVYWPFKVFGQPDMGIAFVGMLGLSGIFMSRSLLRIVSRNFYKRKYIMASAFRERS
ncbi:MAG: DUF5687 family protein [Bacteroidales bacterium]